MAKIAIAFGVAFNCALVGLGVWDYASQAKESGQEFGELGLGGWYNSFAERGLDAANEKIAARPPLIFGPDRSTERMMHRLYEDNLVQPEKPLNLHLPGSRAQWQRQPWTAAHDFLFTGTVDGFNTDQLKAMSAPGKLSRTQQVVKIARLNPVQTRPELADSRIVYQRGGWAIGITLRVIGEPLAGSALETIRKSSGEDRALIQSVHAGIAFRDVTQPKALADGVRVLRGKVTNALEIEVVTNADDRAVNYMLSAIDYKGLNAALLKPASGIGYDTDRHHRLVGAMNADKPHLRNKFETERRRLPGRLNDMTRQARAENWLSDKVCLDFFGTRYCKSVDA